MAQKNIRDKGPKILYIEEIKMWFKTSIFNVIHFFFIEAVFTFALRQRTQQEYAQKQTNKYISYIKWRRTFS